MDRIGSCLSRLRRYVAAEDVALTGGIALRLHLVAHDRAPGDVDLVVRTLAAVDRGVTREFLVSHHHPPRPGESQAFLQLVHPASRLHVDLFAGAAAAIDRAEARALGSGGWNVVTAADLLAHKRKLLARAGPTKPVDPKHLRDAVALARLLGQPPPAAPAWTAPAVYGTDTGFTCARCGAAPSPDFPLAPKGRIFEILGYV